MSGEEVSSTLVVTVDGSALASDVSALLTSAYVDNSTNVPDLFVLRFMDDGAAVIGKAKLTIGSTVVLGVQRSGPGGPQPLMTGEITALEQELAGGGTRTVVRGYDPSHRLFRGRRVAAYQKVSGSDLVRTVAGAAGLQLGTVDSTSGTLEHVTQEGVNDWTFLRRIAGDVGFDLTVADGKLCFRKPAAANAAPSASGGARQQPLAIEKGVNLVSLHAVVTAADQVPEVEVRGWDVTSKKASVAVAKAQTTSVSLPDVTPDRLASTFRSPKWVEGRSGSSYAQCQSAARAIAERLASSHAEIDGIVRGNPAMRAGVAVRLVGAGSPFDGSYTLTSTRHDFSEDGYLTSFSVSGTSERSVYGLTAATGSAQRTSVGVLTATVSDVKDPQQLGRVRVAFPVLSDQYVSGWARTVQLGAGANRGAVVLPEVGDEVLVAFGMGDFGEPYVLGGLYNGKDNPSPGWGDHVDGGSGAVSRRAFTSRTGMVVEMVETAQEEQLTLSTSNGKQRVTLRQKAKEAIEIIAEGPVSVIAKQDAAVESTSGNVSIKGTAITVEAKGDLTLKGVNVTVTAQAAAEISGLTAKVSGQTTAELSASATTTVRGGLVRIN